MIIFSHRIKRIKRKLYHQRFIFSNPYGLKRRTMLLGSFAFEHVQTAKTEMVIFASSF